MMSLSPLLHLPLSFSNNSHIRKSELSSPSSALNSSPLFNRRPLLSHGPSAWCLPILCKSNFPSSSSSSNSMSSGSDASSPEALVENTRCESESGDLGVSDSDDDEVPHVHAYQLPDKLPDRWHVLGLGQAMIGSTEWVEQNLLNLGSKAVAYFNVDCAVQGPGLFVSATPQLDDLLVEVMKQVKDPDSESAYLYEQWIAANRGVNIQRLSRVDSDFAPFLQHAGIASIDLYFGSDFPVYHTAFDSYDWMMNFGDPSFHRHVTAAGIWGLVALRLADDPILPFNYLSYAAELQEYKNILNSLDETISLDPITSAVQEFTAAAYDTQQEIELQKMRMDESVDGSTLLRRRAMNDRLMLAERGFLDPEGLPGREWFKHIIYGPRGDTESKIDFFPGIADAISGRRKEGEEQTATRHEIWRAARAIQRAASILRGQLT